MSAIVTVHLVDYNWVIVNTFYLETVVQSIKRQNEAYKFGRMMLTYDIYVKVTYEGCG